MQLPLSHLIALTIISFGLMALFLNWMVAKAEKRRKRAEDAIYKAHLRRIQLMEDIEKVRSDHEAVLRNLSHDCTVISRDQLS